MDLSLVVTTFNRAHILGRTLASIAALERPAGFATEVLVVDNNSTDATATVLADLVQGWRGPPLHTVFEPRQGLSHARNQGAAQARGHWVAYMDDDQLIAPDYFVEFERALKGPAAEIIGGRIHYHHEAPLPDWLPPLIRTVGQIDLGPKPRTLDPLLDLLKGGNIAIRRDTLMAAGGFDPALGRTGGTLLAGEEDDLQRRVAQAGGRVLYWPGLVQFNLLEPHKLHKQYWRRHAYGDGMTQRLRSRERRRLPPWLLGRLGRSSLDWAWSALRRSPTRFEQELDVWTCLGALRAGATRPRH